MTENKVTTSTSNASQVLKIAFITPYWYFIIKNGYPFRFPEHGRHFLYHRPPGKDPSESSPLSDLNRGKSWLLRSERLWTAPVVKGVVMESVSNLLLNDVGSV
ncbi:hypothetical protein TNCV_675331 [Trichonephila clavipes]|nr:hypothetical protein TNCV_675331 [Trichonephila clavipes]